LTGEARFGILHAKGTVCESESFVDKSLRYRGFRYFTNSLGHFGCVNALSLSKDPQRFLLASGGDDRRVLLWRTSGMPKCAPIAEFGGHMANIFATEFDPSSKTLLSGGNDFLIIRHDLESHRENGQVFIGHSSAVHCLSFLASSTNVFLSASDDGTIRVWDMRTDDFQAKYESPTPFTAVECHPHLQHIFITGNSGFGVKLWDLRTISSCSNSEQQAKCLLRYNLSKVPVVDPNDTFFRTADRSVCGVNFNSSGTQAVVSARHHFPCILPIDLQNTYPIAYLKAQNYRNSTTLKSCTFLGDCDEYVSGGSDDCGIYIWRLPPQAGKSPGPTGLVAFQKSRAAPQAEPLSCLGRSNLIPLGSPSIKQDHLEEPVTLLPENTNKSAGNQVKQTARVAGEPQLTAWTIEYPHQVLRGHRSIPNHTVWHPDTGMLVSCGVEKSLKVWSFHKVLDHTMPLMRSNTTQNEWKSPSVVIPVGLTVSEAHARLMNLQPNGDDPTANTVNESELTIALFDYLARRNNIGGALFQPESINSDDSTNET